MAIKTAAKYRTDLYINKVLVGWTTEISWEPDYEYDSKGTHTGRIGRNTQYPGAEITINRLTKFEGSDEQKVLDAIDALMYEGGLVTMIKTEPKGTLVWNGYGVRPDSESWTDEADEFFEMEFTLQAESFERYWV